MKVFLPENDEERKIACTQEVPKPSRSPLLLQPVSHGHAKVNETAVCFCGFPPMVALSPIGPFAPTAGNGLVHLTCPPRLEKNLFSGFSFCGKDIFDRLLVIIKIF